MTGPAARWIVDALAAPGDALFWAGDEDPPPLLPRPGLRAFTWRLDVAEALRARGVEALFGVPPPPGRAWRFVIRMSKEKALARAAVAAAGAALLPDGELILVGGKGEGVVSLARAVSRAWGEPRILRDGPWRRFTWRRPDPAPTFEAEALLPAPRYEAFGVTVSSSPGVFSWRRLDPGTARLLTWAEGELRPEGAWLDLGCGAGLLARWLADRGADVVAADSSALALRAAEATLSGRGRVVTSDAGGGLEGRFDGVLCNPPFHRGFEHEQRLTERFVLGAARALRPGGRAIIGGKPIVPQLRHAEGAFASTEVRLDDGRYRVVEART